MNPGVVQGTSRIKPFIPRVVIKKLNKIVFAIGAKKNGIKNIGLKIKGAPNVMGSLTLNITGTTAALPIALLAFDLEKKANIKVTITVAPVPPKATIISYDEYVMAWKGC